MLLDSVGSDFVQDFYIHTSGDVRLWFSHGGLLFSPPVFSDMFVKDCCFLLHCFVEFSTEDTDSMLFFMRFFKYYFNLFNCYASV